ncbi:MAG: exodeoxyribonuclease V subunit alpha [Nocardioides sp.]|jgi:exodeoxyribonuclease V alpha subunit
MTELFEPTSERDRRLVTGASGLLGAFNQAGVVEASDVHVASRLGSLGDESDESVLLAVALTVRAVRRGSVCLDLATVPAIDPDLPWPDPAAWARAVAASPLTTAGVLRIEHDLLYLDRYHRLESQVYDDLVARARQDSPAVDEPALAAALERLRDPRFSDEQRDAAVRAVRQWTTVLTGGPGTGKTSTVARILALLADQARANGERISIALAAPTGKAAARLQDAVAEAVAGLDAGDREWVARTDAMTLHRLLGWRADNHTRFRHHRTNRLKYDVVVVDESSMVELTMMARLLDAVRLRSRLVLLGDPRQLTSVGAGAVLSDLVAGYDGDPASPVASLLVNHRSVADIQTLAEALRAGDADGVLAALRAHSDHVEFVETDDAETALRDDAVAAALDIRAAAVAGDAQAAVAALDRHRLLCAHREGPFGVRRWNAQIERWLGEALGQGIYTDWYAGRPILVTTNDHTLEVYNGETGVAVLEEGRLRAYIAGAGGLKGFAPGRLDAIETMHAMTIHKSQGSQADRVTVLLPEAGSRLLTRELFYTAVTRAQRHVRVVGSEAAVRAAVETQAQRATGLRQRLRNRDATPGG